VDYLLVVDGLAGGYGSKKILHGVTLGLGGGEVVAIIGPNGAGKSTTLKAIFGLLPWVSGRIVLEGREISRPRPVDSVQSGLAYVLQGGRVFSDLSVEDNLVMGGFTLRDRAEARTRLDLVYEFFPKLAERRRQRTATLSGGERQMVALGMSLMLRPKVWLLDEPSIGLAPIHVGIILKAIKEISIKMGTAVLLVEQKARQALDIADRVCVMKEGRIVEEGVPAIFLASEKLRQVYLPRAG